MGGIKSSEGAVFSAGNSSDTCRLNAAATNEAPGSGLGGGRPAESEIVGGANAIVLDGISWSSRPMPLKAQKPAPVAGELLAGDLMAKEYSGVTGGSSELTLNLAQRLLESSTAIFSICRTWKPGIGIKDRLRGCCKGVAQLGVAYGAALPSFYAFGQFTKEGLLCGLGSALCASSLMHALMEKASRKGKSSV